MCVCAYVHVRESENAYKLIFLLTAFDLSGKVFTPGNEATCQVSPPSKFLKPGFTI